MYVHTCHRVESIATAILSEDVLVALTDFILLLYTSPKGVSVFTYTYFYICTHKCMYISEYIILLQKSSNQVNVYTFEYIDNYTTTLRFKRIDLKLFITCIELLDLHIYIYMYIYMYIYV